MTCHLSSSPGVPGAATLFDVPIELKGDELTLKWDEPPNNGAEITQYTVYKRTVNEDGTTGDWEEVEDITDPSVHEYTIKLKKGNEYNIAVTATNKFGEGLREEEKIKRIKVVAGETCLDICDHRIIYLLENIAITFITSGGHVAFASIY